MSKRSPSPPLLAQGRFVPRHLGPALAAQERYTRNLLRIEGVTGTAVGGGEDGAAVVKIYTEEREGIGGIPQELDGVPIVVQVKGKVHPVKPPPGKGGGHGGDSSVDPTAAVAATTMTQVGNQFWDGVTTPGQNAYSLTADGIGSLGARNSAPHRD